MSHWPTLIQQRLRILSADCRHYVQWPPSYPRRPFWRLYWNNRPGGHWQSCGKSFHANKKVLILIPPNVPIDRHLDNPLVHAHLHFFLGMPMDLYQGEMLSVRALPDMQERMQMIASNKHTAHWRLAVSYLIHHVLLALPEENMENLQVDHRIQTVLELMQANTHHLLSNRQLAQQCHLSEHAMIRLFSTRIGRSPQAFFLDMRLDQAAVLLREESEKSIENIAMKTGFVDRSHFCKRFAKRYGISPVVYRKSP